MYNVGLAFWGLILIVFFLFFSIPIACGLSLICTTTLRGTQREILRKRPKNNNKAWIKFSETILRNLGDCWKKVSVPHSQQDWWKSSQPATLQPATWITGKFHRAQFRSWVASNPYKKPVAAILDFKSPLTPWIIFFPATLSFQGLLFLPHLPASKNVPEEQIFWGTDPLGAPVHLPLRIWSDTVFSLHNN